jgi:hypothetical protein
MIEGSMAKRKPTDIAQMNLRLPETLRKKIEVEAKKSGWSLNRELVRRLEQSFIDQRVEALIQSTAQTVAMEVNKHFRDSLTGDLLNKFNIINRTDGHPELPIHSKKEEDSNG